MKHIKAHNVGFLSERWNVTPDEEQTVKDFEGENWTKTSRRTGQTFNLLKHILANIVNASRQNNTMFVKLVDDFKKRVEVLFKSEVLSDEDYQTLKSNMFEIELKAKTKEPFDEQVEAIDMVLDKYRDLYNI